MPLRKPPPQDDQLEFFTAIFTDIPSRDARESMEFPFLNLSKKKRFKPLRYTSPSGVEVVVSGGEPYGIANIFDYDLIIYLLSQLRQALDHGKEVSRKIRFTRYGFLKNVRRHTGGDEYARLEAAIARLKNTTISTTIRATTRRTVMFSWIEYADIDRDQQGNIVAATVVLPEWLFDAVCNQKLVLTLHRDYFRLTKGLERFLYRLVRKSSGKKREGFRWKMRTLHERSGSTQEYKYFAREIRKIVADGKLLDYSLTIEHDHGQEYVRGKLLEPQKVGTVSPPAAQAEVHFLRLSTETFIKAKRYAGGYDVYALYEMWKEYNAGREETIKHKDAAFIAFCKKHAEKNPIPAR